MGRTPRKLEIGAGQKVIELGRGHAGLLVEVAIMIDVGRADHAAPFPGIDEHRPLVLRMREDHRLGDRQALERQHDMAAALRTHPALSDQRGAQSVGPGARRVHHQSRRQHGFGAVQLVPRADTGDHAVAQNQIDGFHVVQGPRTIGARLVEDTEHQAGIIHERIAIVRSTAQPVLAKAGHASEKVRASREVMVPHAGKKVIERQHEAENPAPRKEAAIMGEPVTHAGDQPRCLAQQALSFGERMADQPDIALRDVAEAAMHHLRRAARGAPGVIALFQQEGTQTSARAFPCDASAGDAAADHDHVPAVLIQAGPEFGPARMLAGSRARIFREFSHKAGACRD
jgi:hypothetical protein